MTPARVVELATMPYEEYLRTPEWQAQREAALGRAGRRCQVCGRRQRLEVHHNTYARRGEEAPSDLIVLCGGEDGCHVLYHRQGRLARALAAEAPGVVNAPPHSAITGARPRAPIASLVTGRYGMRPPRRRRSRWARRADGIRRSEHRVALIGAALLFAGLAVLAALLSHRPG